MAAPQATFPRKPTQDRTQVGPRPLALLLVLMASSLLGALPTSVASDQEPILVVDPIWTGAIELRGAHVSVDIREGVAHTQISLTLENRYPHGRNAYLDAPLPWQSIPTRIALIGPNITLEGDVTEISQARQTYEQAAQADVDAVLVERSSDNLRLRVHLPADAQRTLIVAYVQVLDQELGAWRYDLPTTRLGGNSMTNAPLTVQVQADSDATPSDILFPAWQPRTVNQSGESWTAHFSSNTLPAPGDLAITWMAPASGPWRMNLVRSEDPFSKDSPLEPMVLTLRPNDLTTGTAAPRDIIFVLDTSGSMRGSKIEDAKRALDEILLDLRPDDRYGIVTFDSYADVWSSGPVRATGPQLSEHRTRLAALSAGGGTNLDAGVQKALAMLADADGERAPMVVLVSDGLPSSGITDHSMILSRARASNPMNAPIHVLAIGLDADETLLEDLAGGSGGRALSIAATDDVRAAMRGFYESLDDPVATDVRIQIDAESLDGPLPSRLAAVYAGGVDAIWFRLDPEQDSRFTVRLDAITADGPTNATFVFDLGAADTLGAVAALWAENQIGQWIDQGGNDDAVRSQVLPLALRYNVATPYTAWILAASFATETAPAEPGTASSPTTPTAPNSSTVGDTAPGSTLPLAQRSHSYFDSNTDGADAAPWSSPGEAENDSEATPGIGLGVGAFALVLLVGAVRARRKSA